MEASKNTNLVPVTLLTGFLGSGKTSRLNATLATGCERIAVIENELGALGVDGRLVENVHEDETGENDGIIELSNGCLCCTGEVDLISALETLARRKRRSEKPFQRVVIETTGLADVGPTIALLRDPDEPLLEDFYLESVVTVVDAWVARRWFSGEVSTPTVATATGFGAQASPGESAGAQSAVLGADTARATFWKQISLADQVVLSKSDLLSANGVDMVRSTLALANPLLRDDCIFSSAASEPLPLSALPRGAGGGRMPPSPFPAKGHRFAKRPRGPAPHLEGVEALSIPLPPNQAFDGEKLKVCALELLTRSSSSSWFSTLGEIWRIKGFIGVDGLGLSLLQGVGDQVSLEPWSSRRQEDAETCEPFLVVIGERLDAKVLEAALSECRSGPPAAPLAS